MIWIWNSISMNYWDRDSDIDLFIVTNQNRLWLNRFIITIIFYILWVKKTARKHAWKLCLSFFVAENSLNFEKIAIKNDIYLYFWIIHLKPILDYDNTYEKFIKINSSYYNFKEYKDIISNNKKYIKYKNFSHNAISSTKKISSHIWWKNSKILNFIEKIIKAIWLPKTISSYKKLWRPYWIVINDDMLKFHNNDRRKKVRKDLHL
jgi:hypothetical protein